MDAATLKQWLREARAGVSSGGREAHTTVLDVLLARAGHEQAALCAALEQHTGVPAVHDATLATTQVQWATLSIEAARELQCVPLQLQAGGPLCVAMADPWDDGHLQRVATRLGHVPAVAAITHAAMAACLQTHTPAIAAAAAGDPNTGADAVALVDGAIEQALALMASDIHFECDRAGLTVKLRQDGVMTTWQRAAGVERAEQVISRIKVLAQLDITERRVPQDGRFRWQGSIDLRVSIMPSIHGEDAVLRLLDKAQLRQSRHAISSAAPGAAATLDALGFEPAQSQRIRDLAALPHGMLLVTGPTGSGKTTTVYATLSEINTGLEKIVTIEDPVEYELPGVLQIPVNERKGLTFAKGLRSILRHDPDRILVGEIRDAETAEIAVQSALTGHQVFTTVHANSIFDVVGRFRHFGLDMFGFMSALNGVIVQRLLRKLCPHCAVALPPAEGAQPSAKRWRAMGCAQCRETGYRGRMVVAEVHVVDDALRDLVTGGAALSLLREQVQRSGASSLGAQGARLVAQGATTQEEVRRVVGWV